MGEGGDLEHTARAGEESGKFRKTNAHKQLPSARTEDEREKRSVLRCVVFYLPCSVQAMVLLSLDHEGHRFINITQNSNLEP